MPESKESENMDAAPLEEEPIRHELRERQDLTIPRAHDRQMASPVALAIGVVRIATMVFTLVVWTIVGFVFWIPLLGRATTAFTMHTLYSNLKQRNARVPSLGLEHAMLFYISGFRNIVDAILRETDEEPSGILELRFWRLLMETAWTLVFWWATLAAFAYVGSFSEEITSTILSPLDWVQAVFTKDFWLDLFPDNPSPIG